MDLGFAVALVLAAVPAAGPRAQDGTGSSGEPAAGEGAEGAPAALPVEARNVTFLEDMARRLGRSGAWLPVYFELEAKVRQPRRVVVEGRVVPRAEGPATVSRTTLEVAPGAPLRGWLYLRGSPGEAVQDARLEFRSGGQVVRSGDAWVVQSVRQFSGKAPRMLVVGGLAADERPWRGRLGSEELLPEAVRRLEPHQLPDRALGYQVLDTLVLRGLDEQGLEPAQIKALRDWVFLGGFVVIAPTEETTSAVFSGALVRELLGDALAASPRTVPGFRPANLYLRPGGDAERLDVSRQAGGRQGQEREETPFRSRYEAAAPSEDLELAPGVNWTLLEALAPDAPLLRSVWSHPASPVTDPAQVAAEGDLLYGEVGYGMGRVGVLLLDDQNHGYRESGTFRQALWDAVLRSPARSGSSGWRRTAARFVRPDLVRNVLADRERDVGAALIGGLVVGYILLVGPGIYFWLRRRNRLPAIVWVEPVVIGLSLAVIFSTGWLTKGFLTKARFVTVFHALEGQRPVLRESYLSIFSADDADYEVSSRGQQITPVFANQREAMDVVISREGGTELPLRLSGYHLNLWQQGHVRSVGVEDKGQGVRIERLEGPSSAGGSEAPIRYRVTNLLPWTLLRGAVIHRSGLARREIELTGPLPSGGEAVVEAARSERSTSGETEEDAREPREAEAEDLLDGLSRYGLGPKGGTGNAPRREPVFWARLDREDEDFRVDRPFTVDSRHDIFIQYR